MRWKLVLHPVPRDEGHRPAVHCTHAYRRRRLAPGGVDVVVFDVVEERIEPRSPEHTDLDGIARPTGRRRAGGTQADFSFLVGPADPAPSPGALEVSGLLDSPLDVVPESAPSLPAPAREERESVA